MIPSGDAGERHNTWYDGQPDSVAEVEEKVCQDGSYS